MVQGQVGISPEVLQCIPIRGTVALRRFQRLSLLLRETLGAEPEEETLRLYRELLTGEVRTAM